MIASSCFCTKFENEKGLDLESSSSERCLSAMLCCSVLHWRILNHVTIFGNVKKPKEQISRIIPDFEEKVDLTEIKTSLDIASF